MQIYTTQIFTAPNDSIHVFKGAEARQSYGS